MSLADELMGAGVAALAEVNAVTASVWLASAGSVQAVTGSFVRGGAMQRGAGSRREDESRGQFSFAVAGVSGVDAVKWNVDTVTIDDETWTVVREEGRSGGHVVWEVALAATSAVRQERRIRDKY